MILLTLNRPRSEYFCRTANIVFKWINKPLLDSTFVQISSKPPPVNTLAFKSYFALFSTCLVLFQAELF